MTTFSGHRSGMRPAWATGILVAVIIGIITLTAMLFNGSLVAYVPVKLTSDRAGLVMEPGGKVKLRGVQVGRVASVRGGSGPASIELEIDPDQVDFIPANVTAQIRAATAFGAKYVDLIYPEHPTAERLSAGAVLKSRNVSTEVNTVLQNLETVLKQIDPAKLNATLSALSEGIRGRGETMGSAITAANEVFVALNPRMPTIQQDLRSLKGFSDAYGGAAGDLVAILKSASDVSVTVSARSSELDALLLNVIGLSRSGIDLLGANQSNLIHAVNALEPTTGLLMKYNPEYTCMLEGGKWIVDNSQALGGNGKSAILDAGIQFGDDAYRYPDNLPIVAAKGGPGGKPGCGSLPRVDLNYPVRQLVSNTGWGTGLDIRTNPGIGHPWFSNYFPVTKAQPEPPRVRGAGPPAVGPPPPGPPGP